MPERTTRDRDLKIELWRIRPVRVPKEVKLAITQYCKENRLSFPEFVLYACMGWMGYDESSIKTARALCYLDKRVSPTPPRSMMSNPNQEESTSHEA